MLEDVGNKGERKKTTERAASNARAHASMMEEGK
jgi:hypothetical protein